MSEVVACAHNSAKLCVACAQLKPWMVFQRNPSCKKDKDCKCCGYFWGPGHNDKPGQRCWEEEAPPKSGIRAK